MRVFTLIAALSFVLMVPGAARAADMLYVSTSSNGVIAYDYTLSTGTLIASSAIQTPIQASNTYTGIAFGSDGSFYAANWQTDTIEKFNSSWSLVSTFGEGQLNNPQGMTFDSSGNLFVANEASLGVPNFVSKFDSSGGHVSMIGIGVLEGAVGVATDSGGNLYVTNHMINVNTISKFDSSGGLVSTIGSGNVDRPLGIAIDSSGNIYVSNPYVDTVTKFNSQGEFVSKFGSGSLSGPYDIAIDSADNIYVANLYNYTVSKFDSSGNYVLSWNTPGPAWLAFGPTYSGPVVPEPSTYILGTLAALTLAILARRRRRTVLA